MLSRRSAAMSGLLLTLIILAGLTCVAAAGAGWPDGPSDGSSGSGLLTVTFVDVGQGDAAWLHTPDGQDILVDAGPVPGGPALLEYLQAHGAAGPSALVLTHPHDDHTGGLSEVWDGLSLTDAPPQVIENGQRNPSTSETAYLSLLTTSGITPTIARAGDVYTWGCCVTASVLYPHGITDTNVNNNSLVLKVSYGVTDFLLTGDIEAAGEQVLLRSLPEGEAPALEADVLKVAHHGSNGSSRADFLAAVQPPVAVISVGAGNRYRHPGRRALDRLQAAGAAIYRTDELGSIAISTDGSTYTIAFPQAPAEPTTTPAAARP